MASPRVAVLAPLLAGCSLIYNPGNLPDPRLIDAAVVDANPCALVITDIAPTVIQEGQGDHGSAPALLVIHGNNIVDSGLKVELAAEGGTVVHLAPITERLTSGDTTYLAFTVTAPVDPALGKPNPVDVPLDVTVTQDAPPGGSCQATGTLSKKLTLHALPELTAGPVTSQTYSMITLPAMTFAAGTPGVELNAVSSITLGDVLASASGTTAGPGGYSAGSAPGPGAGAAGQPAAVLGVGGGGGGGGFAGPGASGANAAANGGSGGNPSGEDQILSYSGNRASAGGTGGGGLTALGAVQPGGAGGGGGGVIVLTAGGDIKTGMVTANGGGGAAGSGSLLTSGGGGGGGAGGTVVVRSLYGTLNVGPIRVAFGGGGTPGGGMGSVGRVRWDSPNDNPPSSPDRAAHRGPTFKAAPRMVTMQQPTFMLVGTSGDELDVRVIDDHDTPHAGPHASFNGGGIATIVPTLSPGYNKVCVKLSGGSEGEAAANACIDVAYLPPR